MSDEPSVSEPSPPEPPPGPEAWCLVEAADGERQLVRDPESYSDWIVISAGLDRHPGEYEGLEDGAIVFDRGRLEADLLAAIDLEAGAFRQRFITEIPGQQMTYLAKEAEARALLAGGDPAASPMIVGGARARDLEPKAMAELVIARADSWRLLGAAIEVRREAAKAAVTAAADVDEMKVAADVDWDGLLSGAKPV